MLKRVIRIAFALALVASGFGLYSTIKAGRSEVVLPKTAAEFAKATAMIVSANKRSGGSGVIVKSTKAESFILTNRHVCELLQQGGFVQTSGQTYKVNAYKLYPTHDLCLVRVKTNLHINTVFARKNPDLYSAISVSGHPQLRPVTLSQGYLSNEQKIEIIVGVSKCDGKETKPQDIMYCIFMGAKPIVKKFESQSTSCLIMPGSSGSGVFNSEGELFALVFAGNSEGLSYGSIVPFRFLKDFLTRHESFRWKTPNPNVAPQKFMNYLLNVRESCLSSGYKSAFGVCKTYPSIWSM